MDNARRGLSRSLARLIALALLCLIPMCPADAEPLFSPAKEGVYNYCPAGFVEDGAVYLYYCTNEDSYVVTDSIGYRTSEDGLRYSGETIVLRNGRRWDDWDTTHVCDPDVVKGEFRLDGIVYHYLMAYLGCRTGNNQGNEIGLAVAQRPEGPFIKVEGLNPFVRFERDLSKDEYWNIFQWGVGQASLISLDRKGRIMLLYTRGDLTGSRLVCETWDLSDLNAPEPIGGEHWRRDVTNRGVMGRDLRTAALVNADAGYDPVSGRLFIVADGAPCYMEGVDEPGEPTFISSNLRVLTYSQSLPPEDMEGFFLRDGTEKWTTIALVGRTDTGYPRNHNAGLMTDPYGWLEAGEALRILYSVSMTREKHNSLWTYRVHQIEIQPEP